MVSVETFVPYIYGAFLFAQKKTKRRVTQCVAVHKCLYIKSQRCVCGHAHTHTHTHAYVRSLYVFDFKNENNNFVLRSYRGVFALILTLQYLAGYDKSRDKKLDSDIYLYNQKKSTCFCESRKTFYLVHDEKVEMEMLKTYRQYILQHLFLHRVYIY